MGVGIENQISGRRQIDRRVHRAETGRSRRQYHKDAMRKHLKRIKTQRREIEHPDAEAADLEMMELPKAVEHAVTECIRQDILKDFLVAQRNEVVAMSIYEYNEEYAKLPPPSARSQFLLCSSRSILRVYHIQDSYTYRLSLFYGKYIKCFS